MNSTFLLPPAVCAGGGGIALGILPWFFGFLGLVCLALAVMQTLSYMKYVQRARRKRRRPKAMPPVTYALYAVAALLWVLAFVCPKGAPVDNPNETTTTPIETTTAPTVPTTGWIEKDGTLRYWLSENEFATGWQDIENKRYYFDSEGMTLSGWQEVDGMRRYFRADGSMARGEETIDGEKYFFTSTGAQIDVANPWNAVPEGYEVELMDLSVIYATQGIQIDVRIWEPLKKMMDACNAAMEAQYEKPSRCCVTSGYRSIEMQTKIFNNKVNNLMANGYSQEAAEAEAATAVAVPGTSEHQLGLAVDIVDTGSWGLTEFQADLPAQQWLMEHCWEYGFILRYPEDKTDVTGIIYEPWHYRYVGTELSLELRDLKLTLEEYLDSLD